MNHDTIQILFALLHSAISGNCLTDEDKALYSEKMLPNLISVSKWHDVFHLIALVLKNNSLVSKNNAEINKPIFEAVYRYERTNYEYEVLCNALEAEQIAFIPLKGAILRKYYKEEWMRTSCDIDILVHKEDLDKAISLLTDKYEYTFGKKGSHDILLYSPSKVNVELHYDLIEDGRVKNSTKVLNKVWKTAVPRENFEYLYDMPDEMFYFYHIVHMAKHFQKGGCGIKPFIDLWILDRIENADTAKRNELLQKGGLLDFAKAARKLSEIWFENAEKDEMFQQIEDYLLYGGVYGTVNNTAKVQAAKGVSKTDSFFKLMFLPKNKLEEIYPNLKKHPFLFPFYQVKRWFRIFNKKKRKEIQKLTSIRNSISKKDINSTAELLDYIGL